MYCTYSWSWIKLSPYEKEWKGIVRQLNMWTCKKNYKCEIQLFQVIWPSGFYKRKKVCEHTVHTENILHNNFHWKNAPGMPSGTGSMLGITAGKYWKYLKG